MQDRQTSRAAAGWVDTHCHLDSFDDPAAAVAEARSSGVEAVVSIGTDLASSRAAVEIAGEHDGVWAAVGIHPHEAATFDDGALEELAALAGRPKVVAIGEIGLDHYRDLSPRAAQRDAFIAQMALGKSLDKTVVLHVRDALKDLFALLEAEGPPRRLVFHCFSGGPADVARALDLGGYISFAGNVSFKNAGALREAAAAVPLDRLLVETDAPFLAPEPNRGKPNHPAWVPLVGGALAAALGARPEEVAAATSANAARVFGLDAL